MPKITPDMGQNVGQVRAGVHEVGAVGADVHFVLDQVPQRIGQQLVAEQQGANDSAFRDNDAGGVGSVTIPGGDRSFAERGAPDEARRNRWPEDNGPGDRS